MALCPKCGKDIGIGAFCGKCGLTVYENQKNNASASAGKISAASKIEITKADLDKLEIALRKAPNEPLSYVNLAEAQLALGKIKQAYSTLRAAKAISPKNSAVLKVAAKIYETMNRPEDAAKALTEHLEQDFDNIDEVIHLSELLYGLGKKQEALVWLGKALKKNPNSPQVVIKIASIYLSLNNAQEAEKFLNHYKKIAGATSEMYILMGQTMLARKFYDGAVKNYSEAIKAFPKDVRMQIGLGRAFLATDEKGRAMLEFERAHEIEPKNPEILIELGKLQYSMGLDEKAEKTFASLNSNNLATGEIFLNVCLYFKERNEINKALKYIEKAHKISPYNPEVQKNFGEILVKLKRFEEACQIYTDAIDANQNCVWAHNGIVSTATATENIKLKAASQKALLGIEAENAEKWCDYGETLIRMGNFDEAKDAFEKASKIDPTCVRAYQAPELIKLEKARAEGEKLYNQAKEALENDFFMTATERLERALKIMPNEPAWVKKMAEIAVKTADIKRASVTLAKLRSFDASDFKTAYTLARVYEYENKYSLATDLLASITRDHPNEFEAQLMLLRIKRTQMRSVGIDKEVIEAMVKNAEQEISLNPAESPVPLLIRGYANYIFSFKSRYQDDGLAAAERVFNEVLARFGTNNIWAIKGLAFCERLRGNTEKAIEHTRNIVKNSSDSKNLYNLAKLHENFQQYGEARKCYKSLCELFPENGTYRRRLLETITEISKNSSKNELLNLLSEHFQKMQKNPENIWLLYETAIGQELAGNFALNSDEWIKRALLTWNKAANHPAANNWVKWGMAMCQIKNLTGIDKMKAANNNLKICEKILLETPNNPIAYMAVAYCHLANSDITHTDKALGFIEKARFLAPDDAEICLLSAKTAKILGKSVIVDAMGYNMILLEPELAIKIFQL